MEGLIRSTTVGRAAGVRGAAAPGYWRLLLQGVKQKPAMFAAVMDSADEVRACLFHPKLMRCRLNVLNSNLLCLLCWFTEHCHCCLAGAG